MTTTIQIELLKASTFLVRWKDIEVAVRAMFATEFGRGPDRCEFDTEMEGRILCFFDAREGVAELLGIPFCVEISHGDIAERIAGRIINLPSLAGVRRGSVFRGLTQLSSAS